jgi:hypothetical protein
MPLRSIGSDPNDISRVANENFRDIDNRFRVNVVRQSSGNAIVQGKLPYANGYGTLYYDTTGLPRIIIGILPDGDIALVVSKEGEDVLGAF